MNILEALKSGRRIRRAAAHEPDYFKDPRDIFYTQERILSDDWEVEPAAVEITYEQLREAYNKAFENEASYESTYINRIAISLGLKK